MWCAQSVSVHALLVSGLTSMIGVGYLVRSMGTACVSIRFRVQDKGLGFHGQLAAGQLPVDLCS